MGSINEGNFLRTPGSPTLKIPIIVDISTPTLGHNQVSCNLSITTTYVKEAIMQATILIINYLLNNHPYILTIFSKRGKHLESTTVDHYNPCIKNECNQHAYKKKQVMVQYIPLFFFFFW